MNELLGKLLAARNDAKYSDYTKHINWIYHKTQDLPNVMLVGKASESIPLRNYKLRRCNLTRLNPSANAPAPLELFADLLQARHCTNLDSDDFANNPKLQKRYIATQNVVIIDDDEIVSDFLRLTNTILYCEQFLTQHGRILFDVPIRRHLDYESELIWAIKTVRTCVNRVNGALRSLFLIEDIKLSSCGNTAGFVGIRVYLKKEVSDLSDDYACL